ncbi:MAG TPA: DUF2249 domain-containing protein [Verrucomicrobiota bacterium]|nr:hypothetical protein [Verrucomicrobiales bacterium]HRI14884.1 DUF2249 domain-containing protein [Verrucomicrobiota bacterium]
MPPLTAFKRFDVRPLIARGEEPLARIRARVAQLASNEGLLLVAPFLPAPLIELLGGEGFRCRFEPGQGGDWIVYFWREE